MNDGPSYKPASSLNPPAAGADGINWRVLGLLMAFSFSSWFNRVCLSVAGAERIIPSEELSKAQVGDILFALLLAYTICMTPAGWFVDRVGPRLALIVMGFGSAFFVAGTGMTALFFSAGTELYLGLLVVGALIGIFMAPTYPSAGKGVALALPWHRRAWANGLITGSAPLGMACAPFVFGSLIDAWGWPRAFICTGVATAVVAGIWMFMTAHRPLKPIDVPKELAAAGGSARGSILNLFANRSLVLLTLGYGAANYFEYLFFFWSQHLFKDVMKLSTPESRIYTGLLSLSSGAGMFAGGWLSDRLSRSLGLRMSRMGVPIVGLLLGAGFLLLGIFSSDALRAEPGGTVVTISHEETTRVLICFALAVAAVGACEGPCWTTAIGLGGRLGGTSGAFVNTGGNLGGMFAPWVTPRVAVRFGWHWAVALGSLACLIGVAMLAFVNPRDRLESET